MTLITGRFDKRATHRIFSEPVALDLINDFTALTNDAIACFKQGRWMAVAVCLVKMRTLSRQAAALVEDSVVVDPYLAVEVAA